MLFLQACKDPNDTGIEVLPDGDLIEGNYVDTFGLSMRTLPQDSVTTWQRTVSLFGNYIDPYFGRITAETYAQYRLTGNDLVFADDLNDISVDSVVLKLDLTDFYGRFNDKLMLEVFEITEDFPEDTLLSNKSRLAVGSFDYANGASIDFSGLGGFLDFVNIRLDDSLAWRLIHIPTDSLVNNSVFTEAFKGLMIRATPVSQTNREPGAVFYTDLLSGLSNLAIHYHDGSKPQTVPFTVTSESPRFHYIGRSDEAGTLYKQIIGDTLTDMPTYGAVQAGLLTKLFVGVPSLQNFDNVIVNKAELTLWVDPNTLSADGLVEPPKTMAIFLADSVGYQEYSPTVLIGSTGYDETNQSYRFTVTNAVMDMISGRLEDRGFVILPTNVGTSLNRAVIGGPGHPTLYPKLSIIYTTLPQL